MENYVSNYELEHQRTSEMAILKLLLIVFLMIVNETKLTNLFVHRKCLLIKTCDYYNADSKTIYQLINYNNRDAFIQRLSQFQLRIEVF